MIRHYKVGDEDNQEEPNSILNRAIVFLLVTKQRIGEVGGIKNLTELETFCYVFVYNPDDVILNVKRRMVDVAAEKYNEVKEDNQLFSWAESAELAERAVQANLREQAAEIKKSGIEEGKRTSLKLPLLHKYGIDDAWVDTLTT